LLSVCIKKTKLEFYYIFVFIQFDLISIKNLRTKRDQLIYVSTEKSIFCGGLPPRGLMKGGLGIWTFVT